MAADIASSWKNLAVGAISDLGTILTAGEAYAYAAVPSSLGGGGGHLPDWYIALSSVGTAEGNAGTFLDLSAPGASLFSNAGVELAANATSNAGAIDTTDYGLIIAIVVVVLILWVVLGGRIRF